MDPVKVLLRRYLKAAWRRRWIGLAVTWLVCLLGWAGVHAVPNSYQSTARLYVDADAVLTPLLHGIAVEVSPSAQLEMLQRTLLSRPNLDTLISKTDLGLHVTSPADRERMVRGLSTAITVTPQSANLFTIQYSNKDPRLARDVVQSLLSIFIESATGNNRLEMQSARRFLEHQIASYEKQLHAMEQRRAAFRAKYADILPNAGNGAPASAGTDTAQRDVERLAGALQDASSRALAFKKQLRGTPPALAAGGAGSTRLAEAEAQLRQLETLYTDRYPAVIEQKTLVRRLKASPGRGGSAGATGEMGRPVANPVYDELTLKLIDEQANITSLQRQLAGARAYLARVQQVQHEQPTLIAQYENMDRDYDVVRKNYDELLGRLQAANIAEAADTQADKVRLRVVDPPEIPRLPMKPNRALLISGVLVVGLGVGAGIAVLLSQLDSSFGTVDELRALGLPVLGGISLLGRSGLGQRMMPAARFAVAIGALIVLYGGLLLHLMRPNMTI
ncbi:MAG: Wzz/FepE/Etk N-terminal domain-containing protein [Pseudomonadota bacterium]|nr:Wzz/FepE/Etk N-terminal domain-containing protein [Pseudomonadota bacterium]